MLVGASYSASSCGSAIAIHNASHSTRLRAIRPLTVLAGTNTSLIRARPLYVASMRSVEHSCLARFHIATLSAAQLSLQVLILQNIPQWLSEFTSNILPLCATYQAILVTVWVLFVMHTERVVMLHDLLPVDSGN